MGAKKKERPGQWSALQPFMEPHQMVASGDWLDRRAGMMMEGIMPWNMSLLGLDEEPLVAPFGGSDGRTSTNPSL